MLHILWLFLKIIGIILLVILGIMVLLVCSVCFVPIRYHGNASVRGDLSSLKAKFKFSWFLHLIAGYVTCEEKKVTWQVRVFWKKMNVEKKVKEKVTLEEESDEDKEEDDFQEKKDICDTHEKELKSESQVDNVAEEKKKQGIFTKIKCFFKNIYDKIQCTIQSICDKIKMLIRQKEQLREFLANEVHKSSWERLIKELVRLFRHIRPRNLKMNLHFGFENPATTGKTLAALSILYPFYFKCINIEPDFEKQIIEGDAYLKGYIRSIHLVVSLISLLFDKNIKITYKAIKNWER